MAGRTPLNVASVSRAALSGFTSPTAADVTNGNVFPNDGFTFLLVFNNDAVVHNFTVQLVNGVDGLTAGPRPYVVPATASGSQLTGPWPVQFYGSQLLLNADNAAVRFQPYSLMSP